MRNKFKLYSYTRHTITFCTGT